MINIIRALSRVKKKEKGQKKDGPKKKEEKGQIKKEKAQKREKKREGTCYYPFSILVLQSSTIIFIIESLLFCHFHILVGIFIYRTRLVYSNDELPEMP